MQHDTVIYFEGAELSGCYELTWGGAFVVARQAAPLGSRQKVLTLADPAMFLPVNSGALRAYAALEGAGKVYCIVRRSQADVCLDLHRPVVLDVGRHAGAEASAASEQWPAWYRILDLRHVGG